MSDDHKQTARELIERMKTVRPTCDKCETRPFVASLKEPDGPPGFEPMAHFAGYVKRCDACATRRTFPWADKLDVDRVAHMLDRDARCQHAFPLAILEETLQYPGAVGYAKYGNVTTIVYPTLRDAICKQCGKTGAEHIGVDGCPVAERKGFEFL